MPPFFSGGHLMLRLFSRFLAYSAFALCLGATAASAQPAQIYRPHVPAMESGPQIVLSNGRCLHIDNGQYTSGTLIVLRNCAANKINQQFQFHGNVLRTPPLKSTYGYSTFCVTVNSGSRSDLPAGSLTLEVCHDPSRVVQPAGVVPAVASNPGLQHWSLVNGAIRRADNVGCIDAGNGTHNGPVLFTPCSGGPSQQWSLR